MRSPKTANGRRSTWRGASPPSLAGGRHGREVDDLLGDPAIGRARGRVSASASSSCSLARRADRRRPCRRTPSVGLTTSSPIRPEHVLELLGIGQQVGRDVLEQRLLAEVVADHLRHVVVDGLVVGDAGAERVGDGDGAGAVGAHEAGNAEHRVGAELERVDEVVVEAPVDGVHAAQPGGRAHVEDLVAHDEVGGLDELDAHLAREEGVLEVGRVQRARASRRRPSPRSRSTARRSAARRAAAAGSGRRGARGSGRTGPGTRRAIATRFSST